jgi:hypothetical protein
MVTSVDECESMLTPVPEEVDHAKTVPDSELEASGELQEIEAWCLEEPLGDDDVEVWEDELDSNVHDPNVKIKSWEVLQDLSPSDHGVGIRSHFWSRLDLADLSTS